MKENQIIYLYLIFIILIIPILLLYKYHILFFEFLLGKKTQSEIKLHGKEEHFYYPIVIFNAAVLIVVIQIIICHLIVKFKLL